MLTRAMCADWGRHGIQANGIGQVDITASGADVLVHVNVGGTLAPDMDIRLANTTLASMAANDFIL